MKACFLLCSFLAFAVGTPAATNPPAHLLRISIEDMRMLRDESIGDDFGLQEICTEEAMDDHGVEYRFVEWADESRQRCRTIELTPGATHIAFYKARLVSPSGLSGGPQRPLLSGNSQRATVHCDLRRPDGSSEPGYPYQAMTYVDRGRLFFTYSINNGRSWAAEQRIDRTSVVLDPGGVGTFCIAARSDGRIGVVYENALYALPGDTEGVIALTEGSPVVDGDGRVTGFDWHWQEGALFDQLGEPVYGSNPVIAPRVLADGNAQWWITWSHLAPHANGLYASQRLSAGIWVALTLEKQWPMVQIDYTGAGWKNRIPVSFDACSADGTPSGDHPSVAASCIDAAFATKLLRNAPEGRVLHLAWDAPLSRCKASSSSNRGLRYAQVLASGDQIVGISRGHTEQPHRWANMQWLSMSHNATNPTAKSHTSPSLAVDNYRWQGTTDQEEPVVAWEVTGTAVFTGPMHIVHGEYPLSGGVTQQLQGIAVNRRGDPMTPDSERWSGRRNPKQYAQLFVAAKEDGVVVDHPSVTAYPADDKTWYAHDGLPAQFTGALAFHFRHPSVGDDIYLALTYPATLWGYSYPWAPLRWKHGGLGFTEPQLSCSKGQRAPLDPHFGSTVIGAMRDALPVDASDTPLYGIHGATHDMLGKETIDSRPFASKGESYLGLDVQLDTLGDAAMIVGEVTVTHGGDTLHVPMNFSEEHPGAREDAVESEVFSTGFHLAAGMTVSAALYAFADSLCLARVATGEPTVTWTADVIDSASGAVLIPMYTVALGGGGTLIALPRIFPAYFYSGAPVPTACVRLRVTTAGIALAHVGIEGLAVHCVSPLARTLGKQVHPVNPYAFTPRSDLAFFPNPTTDWMQFSYNVFDGGAVTVRVIDILGRVVATPVERVLPNGRYAVAVDTRTLPDGTYRVIVTTAGGVTGTGLFVVRR
jgi:hypothetical protein